MSIKLFKCLCSSVCSKLLVIWETNVVSLSQVQFWRAVSRFVALSLVSQFQHGGELFDGFVTKARKTQLSSSVKDTRSHFSIQDKSVII